MVSGTARNGEPIRNLRAHTFSASEIQVHRLDLALASSVSRKDAGTATEPLQEAARILFRRSASVALAGLGRDVEHYDSRCSSASSQRAKGTSSSRSVSNAAGCGRDPA